MPRTFEVITPEHVAIRYELAGFGSRAGAALVDSSLQLLIYLVLAGILQLLGMLNVIPGFQKWGSSILISVGTITFFLVFWGYYLLFETLWNGETPGKRGMGLRVIKDGGYPVDFRAVLIRNLLRPADTLPTLLILPSYGLAFLTTLLNPHAKRLGDLAAGTLVVRHGKDDEGISLPGLGETVVYRLLDAGALGQIARLDREEYRMVKLFLDRRRELPAVQRSEFARRLADPLIAKFHYKVPELGMDYERWLDELDLAYRSRALGVFSQAAVPTPAAIAPTATVPPAYTLPTTPSDPAPPSDGRKW
jgi:uncharacterized RDD family membrane protein YckC